MEAKKVWAVACVATPLEHRLEKDFVLMKIPETQTWYDTACRRFFLERRGLHNTERRLPYLLLHRLLYNYILLYSNRSTNNDSVGGQ